MNMYAMISPLIIRRPSVLGLQVMMMIFPIDCFVHLFWGLRIRLLLFYIFVFGNKSNKNEETQQCVSWSLNTFSNFPTLFVPISPKPICS